MKSVKNTKNVLVLNKNLFYYLIIKIINNILVYIKKYLWKTQSFIPSVSWKDSHWLPKINCEWNGELKIEEIIGIKHSKKSIFEHYTVNLILVIVTLNYQLK